MEHFSDTHMHTQFLALNACIHILTQFLLCMGTEVIHTRTHSIQHVCFHVLVIFSFVFGVLCVCVCVCSVSLSMCVFESVCERVSVCVARACVCVFKDQYVPVTFPNNLSVSGTLSLCELYQICISSQYARQGSWMRWNHCEIETCAEIVVTQKDLGSA